VRVLAALGSALFAYLSVIPAGLVISTVEPACAGDACRTGLAQDVLLTVLYGVSFAALAGTSGVLSLYAFRPTVAGERHIRLLLGASVLAVGLTLLALLALARPLAAAVTLAVGAGAFLLLSRSAGGGGDPGSNGHGRLNGHGPLP
jgi:hypothetical protein